MDALEAENNETAASSQAPVTAAQITIRRGSGRNNDTGGVRNRMIVLSGRLPVCSLMHQVDKLTVDYVVIHEIDYKPVYDHRTGERLPPHLVKVGRQTEHEAMTDINCSNVFRVKGSRQESKMSMARRDERG